MGLEIDRLIRQNRTKWRIIQQREIREYLADKREFLDCIGDRQERDLVRFAYEMGRAHASEVGG